MNYKDIIRKLALSVFALTVSPVILAQDQADEAEGEGEELTLEEVIVTASIRASIANSIAAKRNSDNLIEAIYAEDIGKLPDQNLAEVLENLPGVQITRTAGVGTGVQIRGTNANRTEVNGVSTAGSGTGRVGINFEDVSASIIAGVEVIKAPDAKTIEGSVGGTINLKTIRPLNLPGLLAAARVQGEHSSLSTDGWQPKISGSLGNNWSTNNGEFGFVVSGSWAKSDVSAFRPRADRDNYVGPGDNPSSSEHYLPIQFFVQDYDNYETETSNIVTTFEWAPNEDMRFFFDGVWNDQDANQESSRVQTSGVSTQRLVARVDEFELVDFGTLLGENGLQDLGSINAAVMGVIPAQLGGRYDPNLRLSSDTNSRSTDSSIYSFGGEWTRDRFWAGFGVSWSKAETKTPNIATTLNFINPNAPFGDPNENGTPIRFDLRESLAFGIAEGEPTSPSTAELLDPANYRLRDWNITDDYQENKEDAARLDFKYDFSQTANTLELDFGWRYNKTGSTRENNGSNYGLRNMIDAPPGNMYASVLVPGPDNFDDADGRQLFFPDFLVVDPEQLANDPAGATAIMNEAIAAYQAMTGSTKGGIDSPTSESNAFFDITEKTNAFYLQGNFGWNLLRGNLGVRYLDTDITSRGFRTQDGETVPTELTGSYSFWLPRLNIAADVTENIVVRGSWGKDIRRPDFDNLSTSFTFSTSPNPAVELGNPGLEPEEVKSFDIGFEWYFAPGSVVSVGYFHKKRTGLFSRRETDPVEDEFGFRDTSPPCEEGGIFNPIADPNVFAPPGTPLGVCVPTSQVINGSGSATQKGVELVFTYDLAQFEDKLGWASGFGFTGNYTWQDFDGVDEYLRAFSRPTTVFNALGATDVVTWQQQLIDLSEKATNLTLYYERYNISARVRYTWREGYRSTDFGSTSSFPWGFPVVQEDRSQLNASVSYAFLNNWSVSLEGINLTKEKITQSCVNEGALFCYQGLTDRRYILGVAYRY